MAVESAHGAPPDGGVQGQRPKDNNADFEQFTADIRRNGILVPVRYVRSGGRNWLVDGNHRVKAVLRAGETQIPAEEVSLPYGRFQNEADLRDYFWKRFMDSENR